MNDRLTIQSAIEGLHNDLRAYLEAAYHVRDESVLRERSALLNSEVTISQRPYLEATPAYLLAEPFGELDLPAATRKMLTDLAAMANSGIYPKPYVHQAAALRSFLKEGRDVLAATGTGSGKTEIFLLSIIGALVEECRLGEKVTRLPGFRALILYPMNALVADQLARLRRMIGNTSVADMLQEGRKRRVRFGMYTSRTPFPGEITSPLNKSRCRDLWRFLYKPILENEVLLAQLKSRGKWPAKDVASFFGDEGSRWEKRLRTAEDDVELLMRHEIQASCPDILITNYAMLEYMMLRPIERNIFAQTARWLKNAGTFLTVVLDEAHMYRGATGAEVAFLLRRLFARLGISRKRVRFILTTASVGKGADDEDAARDFACDLTGLSRDQRGSIAFIRGAPEIWSQPLAATGSETIALSEFDGARFASLMLQQNQCAKMLNALGDSLGWSAVSESATADDLYRILSTWGPAQMLVNRVAGSAEVLDAVTADLFPNTPNNQIRNRAMDALLRICNFARQDQTRKVFLPARLHLFFRGLSGVFSCVNPRCSAKRDKSEPSLLGRLFSEPRVQCDCGSRVLEVLTHRDCGALFLRGFVAKEPRPTFVWHEPTTGIGDESSGAELSLEEIHLLVTPTISDRFPVWQPAWLQIRTGQLRWEQVDDFEQWLPVYVTDDSASTGGGTHVFASCPACGSRTQNTPRDPSRIMDLRTKGEQPFGQLVKRQLFSQTPDPTKSKDQFPNQGRKVLLFSDGRQKAARLAKAIPDEVESDAFRELLARGYSAFDPSRLVRLQLSKTYAPFVAACAEANVSPFSGEDAEQVRSDVRTFKEVFASDVDQYAEDCPAVTPLAFRAKLYRQACGGLYSFRFICAGWLVPSPRYLAALKQRITNVDANSLEEIATTWIQWLAWDSAIDAAFDEHLRPEIAGFDKGNWAHKGNFRKRIAEVLRVKGIDPGLIQPALQETFASFKQDENGYYLNPDRLVLRIALDHRWYRCGACFVDSPHRLFGRCPQCGAEELTEFDPNEDRYVESRKGFWRNPVKDAFERRTLPRLVTAEEHSAQLSSKDEASGWIKTEEYELRFQDVLTDPKNKPAVDVLSCTTTMEVGVDIGSLVAVGLRNVPPQRENYQQRAGRAGRRGSAVSTVVTYCQGGAHDNHYFSHVDEIASGSPRKLIVKVDNAKIARRHVRSYLLQKFFTDREGVASPDILSSLGSLEGFFEANGEGSLADFRSWMAKQISSDVGTEIATWVGEKLGDVKDVVVWAGEVAQGFVNELDRLRPKVREMIAREEAMNESERTKLLEFLLAESLLPTYAFPTDLATFRVEDWDVQERNLVVRYAPQQSIARSLSEYAPGRLITIDKRKYKSAAVTANVASTAEQRARPLFSNPHRKPYIFCDQKHCGYVEDADGQDAAAREAADCPLCGVGKLRVVEMITPEVFLPDDGREVSSLDDDMDFSYATPAQFPVPIHQDDDRQQLIQGVSERLKVFRRADAQLVVVNKGDGQDQSGFYICDACGRTSLATVGPPPTTHETPYKVLSSNRGGAEVRRCRGTIRHTVFLGHRFVTDLVVLRVQLTPPLCQVPRALGADYCALQDALQTVADALPLAAGRMFDVDFSEFSAGYRLIRQANATAPLGAEIYMFDTLSGGAGYSERVGESMNELLRNYIPRILACDDEIGQGCDRSCYRCLRHYYNQFYHASLDRHLAHSLLMFILEGEFPSDPSFDEQQRLLRALSDMLQLDGIGTQFDATVDGIHVPLLAQVGARRVAICVTHSLTAEQFRTGLVNELDGSDVLVRPLNAYQLTRNLPACHLAIRKCLGFQHSS
jgi:ATP-dependent helicase YprA (DUF1998 family)/predicted  nucleic acid-binding Zn-ribbon protein